MDPSTSLSLLPSPDGGTVELILPRVHLAGETVLDEELVDAAVRDLNLIVRTKEAEKAQAVAEYVLDHFFAGDLDLYLSRGADHVSLRRLTDHPRLNFSHTFLSASLRVLDQLRQIPEELTSTLSFSHQRALLTVRSVEQKVELARMVGESGMSYRALMAKIETLQPPKRKNPTTKTPPPAPPASETFAPLTVENSGRVLDGATTSILLELEQLVAAAERVRERLRGRSGDLVSDADRARIREALERATERLDNVIDDLRPDAQMRTRQA